MLGTGESLFDALEVFLQERVPLQVKVVLSEPLATLLPAVEIRKVTVLNIGSSVAQDYDKTDDKGALADRVGQRLNQVPSEPRHVVYSVVADSELGGEESSQGVHLQHVPTLLCHLDLRLALIKRLKLELGEGL